MKSLSQRAVFTIVMAVSAALFGTYSSALRLRGQADIVGDLAKIGVLIFIAAVLASFIYWSLTCRRKGTAITGALAGLLTAVTIVPLPMFVFSLKTGFFSRLQTESAGVFEALFASLAPAFIAGVSTFEAITKMSLAAVIGSMIVGMGVSRFIPNPAAKNPAE